MELVYIALFVAVIFQLYRIRTLLEDIALPLPPFGGGLLSDLGGVPIPSDGVCGRWDGEPRPSDSVGSPDPAGDGL